MESVPGQNDGKAGREWALDELVSKQLDRAIDLGLQQLKQGEKISGAQVHAEIRKRSQQRRAS